MLSRSSGLQRRSAVGIGVAIVLALSAGVAYATSMSNGTYEPKLDASVPNEKVAQVEHALPPGGSESSAPAQASAQGPTSLETPVPAPVFDRIPGHMLSADTPVPVSPELVDVENGWLVSDGKTLVAIYAGAAGNDSTRGRFVIVRQDLAAGRQTMDVVDVPGAGAVSITDAPKGVAVETTAQRDRIRFRGTRGPKGDLDLVTDKPDTQ